MIVILNNGTRIKISKEFAQAICQNILKGFTDAAPWQLKADIENNAVSGFNLRQVAAICSEEDIVE